MTTPALPVDLPPCACTDRQIAYGHHHACPWVETPGGITEDPRLRGSSPNEGDHTKEKP